MEREKLTKLARELNDIMGLHPPIDVDSDGETIISLCKEASGLLEKGDALSDMAIVSLKELGCTGALKKIEIKNKKRRSKNKN